MQVKIKKLIISIHFIFIGLFIIGLNVVKANDKLPVLSIDGQTLEYNVGDELNLKDVLMPYVDNLKNLKWEVTNEDVIYLVEERLFLYALKAGTSTIKVSSETLSLESTFTVNVKKVNLYPEGNLEHFALSDAWTEQNQTVKNWRLYTGGASVNPEIQTVKIDEVTRDGKKSKTFHADHKQVAYSTLYYEIPLIENGNYYVEFDMKGENITNQRVFGRFNQGKNTETATIGMNGTFDWQTFTSDIVTVTDNKLKTEMYGANYKGKVWYDNIGVYKILTREYFDYNLNTELINLEIGSSFQVEAITNPESIINYHFYYKTLDEDIATVDEQGLVTALKGGLTELIVTDKENGLEKRVFIIVGAESNLIAATINLSIKENSTKEFEVEYTGNTNLVKTYKYENPTYGKYYVKDNKTIVYSPNKGFNSEQLYSQIGEAKDSFKVILYEEEVGYKIVAVNVFVEATNSPAIVVDFWLSTKKNTPLNEGYIEIISSDIEVEIPEKQSNVLKDQLLDKKRNAYANILTTLSTGSLTGNSREGGTIELLNGGKAVDIKDRYFSALGNYIFGVKYKYTPKEGFFGYDHFDITISNGSEITTFTAKIYVSPDQLDFKFEETNFNGLYVVGNDDWIDETVEAYGKGDLYITRWLEEIESKYVTFRPIGNPATSRGALEELAVLYRITKNPIYGKYLADQLYEVTKDNTNPGGDGTKRLSWGGASNGFLDAAMATYSVALAYNFAYDYLDATQKETVVRALYEEGFYFFETLNNPNVLLHGNNHNLLITANLAVAALSVMSYEDDLDVTIPDGTKKTINVKEMAANTFAHAYEMLQIALVHYSPSGGFPEGPGYSYYAHRNIVSLIATLKNIYGGDKFEDLYTFGLNTIEGIIKYPEFALYSSTPNEDVYYYNEGGASLNQPGIMWYARMDDKYIPYTLINKIAFDQGNNTILGLLWYKPGSFDNLDPNQIEELDKLLEVHELATFRQSFGDKYGIFAGLKGFNPTSNLFTHKSLDSGTIELVAFGEKFIENFSNEDYSKSVPSGYWDYDYGRWTYYRKQPQGHNTIVFNPSKNPVLQQEPNAKAPITKFESKADGGFAIVDLTDVYNKDVLKYERGLKLDTNRSIITLQDEFKLREDSEFYWAVHTKANIEIINEKIASLNLNGKKVYAVINSEIGTFSKMAAVALPGTVGKFGNLTNEGINKLLINEKNIYEGTVSVTFIPSLDYISNTDLTNYQVTPLKDWEINNNSYVKGLKVNDITFNAETGYGYKYEFNPNQYSYLVKLADNEQFVPKLNVNYDNNKYDVEVFNAEVFGQSSKVKLTETSTGNVKYYTYRFVPDTFVDLPNTYSLIENINISGKSENLSNLIDGTIQTRWTTTGREEVIFEFSKIERVSNISMRFPGGVLNKYYFDIFAGDDLDNLKLVYTGNSENAIGDEIYSLGELSAKYIKVVFNGNNDNYETSLSRINFYNNNLIIKDEDQIDKKPKTGLIIIITSSVVVFSAALAGTIIYIRKKRR